MQEIAAGVYVEAGYYGVTVGAIVTDDGIVCIDSPMLPADARDWRARLADLTPGPVRYVVYTDVQRERVWGSHYLGGAAVAHEMAWEAMKGYGDAFRQQTADFMVQRLAQSAPLQPAMFRAGAPRALVVTDPQLEEAALQTTAPQTAEVLQTTALQTTALQTTALQTTALQTTAEALQAMAELQIAEEMSDWQLVLPQITFTRRLTLYCGATRLVLKHVGGPTAANLWVLLPDHKLMFAGDVISLKTHPNLAEADVESWLTWLRRLMRVKSPIEIFVPGRGGLVCGLDDIKPLYTYLLSVRRLVRHLISSGSPRSSVNTLVQQLIGYFPAPDSERDQVYRRIKVGLEHVYELYSQQA